MQRSSTTEPQPARRARAKSSAVRHLCHARVDLRVGHILHMRRQRPAVPERVHDLGAAVAPGLGVQRMKRLRTSRQRTGMRQVHVRHIDQQAHRRPAPACRPQDVHVRKFIRQHEMPAADRQFGMAHLAVPGHPVFQLGIQRAYIPFDGGVGILHGKIRRYPGIARRRVLNGHCISPPPEKRT